MDNAHNDQTSAVPLGLPHPKSSSLASCRPRLSSSWFGWSLHGRCSCTGWDTPWGADRCLAGCFYWVGFGWSISWSISWCAAEPSGDDQLGSHENRKSSGWDDQKPLAPSGIPASLTSPSSPMWSTLGQWVDKGGQRDGRQAWEIWPFRPFLGMLMLKPPSKLMVCPVANKVPPPLPSPHQTRYHRFTVMFESPSEDSLVFNVDSCEDPEAATVVESLKVVNSEDG